MSILSQDQKIAWYNKTCKNMIKLSKRLRWKIEFVPIKALWKLREFDRDVVDDLMYSIIENGLRKPVTLSYIDYSSTIYLGEGNHRLIIAKSLGIEALPTRLIESQLYPSDIGLKTYSLKELCRRG